ncbi:MAG: hypothetical protein ABEI86_02320, partial [Halobacteriaceae archaeon]
MEYTELRDILIEERSSSTLSNIDDSFYKDVHDYLSDLEEEREDCSNPFADASEVDEISQELANAEETFR